MSDKFFKENLEFVAKANRYYGFVAGLSAALQILRDNAVPTTDPSREAIFDLMLKVTSDDVAERLNKAQERNSQ